MNLTTAVFARNEIEPGWPVLSEAVPIGKLYTVDLDRIEQLNMFNRSTGKVATLHCIWVVDPEPAGWLPLMIFDIAERVNLAGVDVSIVSSGEALEQVSYVVCGDVSNFPDDVHTRCSCGAAIVHRPYAPKKPPKICLNCYITLSAEGTKH